MSRSSAKLSNPLNVARYLIMAAILFGFTAGLLNVPDQTTPTTISVVAQAAEAIACILLLWHPMAGLAAALIPMALTLTFGVLEADTIVTLAAPLAVAAVERPVRIAGATGWFLSYAFARGILVRSDWSWQEVTQGYLVLLICGLLLGLGIRGLLAARGRRERRVQALRLGVEEIRTAERSELAVELRSLMTSRLDEANRVVRRARAGAGADIEEMQKTLHTANSLCTAVLSDVRGLVGILREDLVADAGDESVTGSIVSTVVADRAEQLRSHGVRFKVEIQPQLDGLARIVQATIIRAVDETVTATLLEDADRGEFSLQTSSRNDWATVNIRYPSALIPDIEEATRLEKLRVRTESCGGSLQLGRTGGERNMRLVLPAFAHGFPVPAPPAPQSARRVQVWGPRATLRGLPTVLLLACMALSGAEVPSLIAAGIPPWNALAAGAGYLAAAAWLWSPVVGAALTAVAVPSIMTGSAPDIAALFIVLALTSWHSVQRVRGMWGSIGLVALFVAGWVLYAAGIFGFGPEASTLIITPTIIAPLSILLQHFRTSRQRHLSQTQELLDDAERMRTAERNLLARELHDIVAHQVSVASLQHMAYSDSKEQGELALALQRMEHFTGAALDEMELLGRIMSDVPTPNRELLVRPSTVGQALATALSEQGIDVTVSLPPQIDDLPATIVRTLTRAMQEAATNIMRYAEPGGACSVNCTITDDEVNLRITNEVPSDRRTSAQSLGYGLVGLRERVDLMGGRFRAGPVGAQWQVEVILPTLG